MYVTSLHESTTTEVEISFEMLEAGLLAFLRYDGHIKAGNRSLEPAMVKAIFRAMSEAQDLPLKDTCT